MQQVVYLTVAVAVAAAILSIAATMKAVLPPPEAPLEHAEALVFIKVKPFNGSYWLGVYAPYGDVVVRQIRVGNATYVLDTTAPAGRDVWLNASGKPLTVRCGDSLEIATAKGVARMSLAFTVQCPVSERRVEMVAVMGKYFEAVAKYVLGFNETKIIAYLKDPITIVVKNVSPEPLLLTVNQFPKIESGGDQIRWAWSNKIYGWIDLPGAGLVPSSLHGVPGDARCIFVYHNLWRGSTSAEFGTLSEFTGKYSCGGSIRCAIFCRVGMASPQLPPLVYSGSGSDMWIVRQIGPGRPKVAPNYDWMPYLLKPNQTIELPLGDYIFSVYPAETFPYFSNSTLLLYTAGIAPWRTVGVVVTDEGAVQWLAPGLQVKSAAVPFNGVVTLFGGLKANITTVAGAAIVGTNISPTVEKYYAISTTIESFGEGRYECVNGICMYKIQRWPRPCIEFRARGVSLLRSGAYIDGVFYANAKWCPNEIGMWKVYVDLAYTVYRECWGYDNEWKCEYRTVARPVINATKVSDELAYYVYVNGTLVGWCAAGKCKSGARVLYYYSLAPYAYNYLLVHVGGGRRIEYAGWVIGVCGHSAISLYKLDRDWTSYELVSKDEKNWPCPDYSRSGGGGGGGEGPWYKIVRVNARKVGLVDCSSGRCTWAMEYDTYAVYSDGTRQYLGTDRLYGTVQTGNGQIYVVDKDNPSITCPATDATTRDGYLTCSNNNG